jgi:hypothetical protein
VAGPEKKRSLDSYAPGGADSLRLESCVASPLALDTKLLEASMGPTSNKGRITGHGNLVEERPKWRTTGTTIAASQ